MTSLNEATRYTAKKEVVEHPGKVFPRIIAVIAEEPEDDGPIFFRKINTNTASGEFYVSQ